MRPSLLSDKVLTGQEQFVSILIVLIVRGVAQFGSVLGSGPRGRGFESRRPDHLDLLKV